eukprot:TRINITY_DN8212_c0_g2_i1.p1 TRINITY_DN8212_c0_g2~~TRINITY_DN8212_c0_g2_i1.p1  ORF type:complete len:1038 (+),score=232.85 TRINITY_DN8212_c0_g2_i1:79-3114(+)
MSPVVDTSPSGWVTPVHLRTRPVVPSLPGFMMTPPPPRAAASPPVPLPEVRPCQMSPLASNRHMPKDIFKTEMDATTMTPQKSLALLLPLSAPSAKTSPLPSSPRNLVLPTPEPPKRRAREVSTPRQGCGPSKREDPALLASPSPSSPREDGFTSRNMSEVSLLSSPLSQPPVATPAHASLLLTPTVPKLALVPAKQPQQPPPWPPLPPQLAAALLAAEPPSPQPTVPEIPALTSPKTTSAEPTSPREESPLQVPALPGSTKLSTSQSVAKVALAASAAAAAATAAAAALNEAAAGDNMQSFAAAAAAAMAAAEASTAAAAAAAAAASFVRGGEQEHWGKEKHAETDEVISSDVARCSRASSTVNTPREGGTQGAAKTSAGCPSAGMMIAGLVNLLCTGNRSSPPSARSMPAAPSDTSAAPIGDAGVSNACTPSAPPAPSTAAPAGHVLPREVQSELSALVFSEEPSLSPTKGSEVPTPKLTAFTATQPHAAADVSGPWTAFSETAEASVLAERTSPVTRVSMSVTSSLASTASHVFGGKASVETQKADEVVASTVLVSQVPHMMITPTSTKSGTLATLTEASDMQRTVATPSPMRIRQKLARSGLEMTQAADDSESAIVASTPSPISPVSLVAAAASGDVAKTTARRQTSESPSSLSCVSSPVATLAAVLAADAAEAALQEGSQMTTASQEEAADMATRSAMAMVATPKATSVSPLSKAFATISSPDPPSCMSPVSCTSRSCASLCSPSFVSSPSASAAVDVSPARSMKLRRDTVQDTGEQLTEEEENERLHAAMKAAAEAIDKATCTPTGCVVEEEALQEEESSADDGEEEVPVADEKESQESANQDSDEEDSEILVKPGHPSILHNSFLDELILEDQEKNRHPDGRHPWQLCIWVPEGVANDRRVRVMMGNMELEAQVSADSKAGEAAIADLPMEWPLEPRRQRYILHQQILQCRLSATWAPQLGKFITDTERERYKMRCYQRIRGRCMVPVLSKIEADDEAEAEEWN